MDKKYHINPKTARAGECHAKIKCEFGGESGTENHYDSMDDARKAIEEKLSPMSVQKPQKKKPKPAAEDIDNYGKERRAAANKVAEQQRLHTLMNEGYQALKKAEAAEIKRGESDILTSLQGLIAVSEAKLNAKKAEVEKAQEDFAQFKKDNGSLESAWKKADQKEKDTRKAREIADRLANASCAGGGRGRSRARC